MPDRIRRCSNSFQSKLRSNIFPFAPFIVVPGFMVDHVVCSNMEKVNAI